MSKGKGESLTAKEIAGLEELAIKKAKIVIAGKEGGKIKIETIEPRTGGKEK